MKAMRVAKYGGPEELQLQELPPPKPGAGEVLVRVQAAGVNYADIYFRNGAVPRPTPFPFTLGIEGAGVVEAVGEGMTELKRGDRVAYASTSGAGRWSLGSYAEYDVVKAAHLAPLPDGVSFHDGAAIILQGLTAHISCARILSHQTRLYRAGARCGRRRGPAARAMGEAYGSRRDWNRLYRRESENRT
jgi:NADPH2:quinone reductase